MISWPRLTHTKRLIKFDLIRSKDICSVILWLTDQHTLQIKKPPITCCVALKKKLHYILNTTMVLVIHYSDSGNKEPWCLFWFSTWRKSGKGQEADVGLYLSKMTSISWAPSTIRIYFIRFPEIQKTLNTNFEWPGNRGRLQTDFSRRNIN